LDLLKNHYTQDCKNNLQVKQPEFQQKLVANQCALEK